MPSPSEIAGGVWRWTARHPDWHPPGFGDEVCCYALRDGAGTLLLDPLLPPGDDGESFLDAIVTTPVRILVTLPYHTRSAEPLAARYDATIHGHAGVAQRLKDPSRFRPLGAGDVLAGGIEAFAVGSPVRAELPLHLPAQRALAFGDVVVEHEGRLRVWIQQPLTPKRVRWYEHRYRPTLLALADLDVDRVLVTHGQPVLEGGRAALAEALAAPPWYHRAS